MSLTFHIGRTEVHLPTVLLTLALGAAGGLLARQLHVPLALLLGSLLAVGGASVFGVKLAGRLPALPQDVRLVFVPVIGVSIGGAFTPDILREAALWWPSLVALALFIPLAHWIGFRALSATGQLDPVTAFFGTAPGGLMETVQMGEEMGADVPMLTMLQFMRLILTIVLVPIFFAWMTGHAVGSAGGASMGAREVPGLRDVGILLAAGIIGAVLGRRTRIPAGIITGPVLLSGAAHLAGLTEALPPGWLIGVTQVVIGTTLGVRFAGVAPRAFVVALRLAALNVTLTMALAGLIAVGLAPLVHEPRAAVFLAFAPGGLAEMSLIALSLQISVLYVTAHHVLRIVLAVTVAQVFSRRLKKP